MTAVLLDTHAAIWLVAGIELSPAIRAEIVEAGTREVILVSPISAWEIGMLVKRELINLDVEPLIWFDTLSKQANVSLAPFTPEIAIKSATLPEPFHRDPADRLLVTTARVMNIPIVTRDRKILDYAEQGHVRAIAC